MLTRSQSSGITGANIPGNLDKCLGNGPRECRMRRSSTWLFVVWFLVMTVERSLFVAHRGNSASQMLGGQLRSQPTSISQYSVIVCEGHDDASCSEGPKFDHGGLDRSRLGIQGKPASS